MKPKIAAVFMTTHADTVGNSNRLRIFEYFAQCFELVIYTNKVEFIAGLIPAAKIKGFEDKLARKKIKGIRLWKSLAESINLEDVDAVFLTHDTSVLAIWIKYPVFQYTRQLHDMIGLNKKRKLIQYIYEKITEQVALIGLRKSIINFVVSEPILEYLGKKKVPNLILTPHGVKLKLFAMPYITDFHRAIVHLKESDHFIVSYTGWVSEKRGLWLMLESIKEAVLKDDKIVLIIAGCEEKYLNIIDSYTRENELRNNLIFYGRIDHTLVPGILYLSDVCLSFLEVNPSFEMSPPQKVIEYFAAGKPVLANRIKTHEMLINDRYNGFILEENADIISETILKIKNDKSLLEELSANALETASKYDFDLIYGGMVNQMKEYVKERK